MPAVLKLGVLCMPCALQCVQYAWRRRGIIGEQAHSFFNATNACVDESFLYSTCINACSVEARCAMYALRLAMCTVCLEEEGYHW